MKRVPLRHFVIATIVLVSLIGQETWALAGVTGGLSGTIVSADTSAPIAGAQITASSPSQVATTTTDASGHFTFLTLAPDTYTVTASKAGYQSVSAPGQIVFADTVQTITVRLPKALKTIAHVSATAAGALVKSGTTADVYSINSATQHAVAALGGGTSLNSAYSAVASAPGAYVPPNQMGYFQTVMIRGGDYDQVGYEFDGVPINRSFDNYPSSSASSLGNAEVQVYTGAPPPNSEGVGLSGYINQVIKTGTYPGYATASLGIGTPTFYHRAAVEVGGATPDRNFSYYLGVAGFNQDFRELDNDNAASYDNFIGTPMSFTGNAAYAPDPNGFYAGHCPGNDNGLGNTCQYFLGGVNYAGAAWNGIRNVVANVHIGIPHRNDAGRDDVQLLWDSESILTGFYSTTNDIVSTQGCSGPTAVSGAACANAIGLGVPVYIGGVTWSCPSSVGRVFTQAALAGQSSCVTPYSFPNSGVAPGTTIPYDASDTMGNNQEIVKAQYTKSFGSTAFLRVYGYMYYSDWLYNAPQSLYSDFAACCPADYELSSHTRGASASFQDQINTQNLLDVEASYVTSTSIRDNNEFYTVGGETAAPIVSAANPYGGICYGGTPGKSATTLGAVSCGTQWTGSPGNFGGLTFPQIQAASGASSAFPSLTGLSCGGSACEYLLAENGLNATYNEVTPRFFATSLTDQFRPSDKWLFNLGARLDSFTFIGSDTDTGLARAFWTNAFNRDNCINALTGAPTSKDSLNIPVTSPCPSGFTAANWQNTPANFTYNIWQPRIAGTYTVNPDNVIRFSYGRYPQAPNTAYEQYDTLQEDLADYDAANFYQFGRTSPGYPIVPPTSLNYDLSWEHHFRGTDWSFKLTPFLRQTQDQIQSFFLNQKTGFISGLNVGSQRSEGVEFSMQKGDFSRNGLSGMLSFTYTNSYINYGSIASGLYGTSVIAGTNDAISAYNAFTKNCAPKGVWAGKMGPNHVPYCGTALNRNNDPVVAAPCYTTSGAPVYHCTAADVGNPYWNNPQALIDPTQAFPTYTIFPGGVGSSAAASGVPYVAALVLNYKQNKLAVTPSLQFEGGGKYGYPQSMPGIDPAACFTGKNVSGILPGVPGANGGSRYNALACSNALAAIPDTYTNVFDPIGGFTQPNNLILNLQLTYDATPTISFTGVLANIVNTCWGGTKAPWTYTNDNNICSYAVGGFAGAIMPVGNVYNPAGYPGSIVQQFRKYPYNPTLGPFNQNSTSIKTPFEFYGTANIKI